MSDNRLTTMVKRQRNLKDTKEALELQIKDINKELRSLAEHDIPEYMADNDIDKVTIEGVGTVFVQQQFYASIKADNKAEVYQDIRDSGNEDLIQPYIFPATLKSFCKEQLENGKPIPEGITAHYVPTAMLRRK